MMNEDSLLARELYNKQFESFAKQQQAYIPVQELRKKAYDLLDNVKNTKILFAGCGDGSECVPLVTQGAIVTGIDISEKAIEHAKNNCSPGEFYVMDLVTLTFEQNTFDAIIALFSVMYVCDLVQVLQEFHRVLKHNGSIILAVPHPVRKMMKYNNHNYFIKGRQKEIWKGVERFGYYRLFEDYIDAFVQSNLKMVKLVEPKPIKETEQTPDSEVIYPHFLLFKLIKD